jgi:heterodisulfide reductase subunit A-like polyferredoxin
MFGLKNPLESREHAGSYYADTANWQTQYPTLENDIEADVVVIGGGFTGVNTALELAERGADVVLPAGATVVRSLVVLATTRSDFKST